MGLTSRKSQNVLPCKTGRVPSLLKTYHTCRICPNHCCNFISGIINANFSLSSWKERKRNILAYFWLVPSSYSLQWILFQKKLGVVQEGNQEVNNVVSIIKLLEFLPCVSYPFKILNVPNILLHVYCIYLTVKHTEYRIRHNYCTVHLSFKTITEKLEMCPKDMDAPA